MKNILRYIFFTLCILVQSQTAMAESEVELTKEFTAADVIVEGEIAQAIIAAAKSFSTTAALKGEGRFLRSYFVSVAVSPNVLVVWFTPRMVDGKNMQFHGAIATKITLRRRDLKFLGKELYM